MSNSGSPCDPEGHGEHSSARLVTEFRPIVEGGATLLGAFIDDLFAGIAIVEPLFEEGTAWFAFLHVSRAYRRRGVAAALWAGDRCRRRRNLDIRIGDAERFSRRVLHQSRMPACCTTASGALRQGTRRHSLHLPGHLG